MSTSLVLLLVLAAPAHPVRLASPGLTGVNIKPAEATFFSDHLAQQLTLYGVPVITQSEIAQLLGQERQKQLMGCDTGSSCMAELVDALGADGLVTGSIGHIGEQYQINVKVIRTRDAQAVAVFSSKVAGAEQVLTELTRAADQMSAAIAQAFGVQLAERGFKVWPAVLPVGLGAASIVAGALLFADAHQTDVKVRAAMPGSSNDLPLAEAQRLTNAERTEQIAGTVCVAAGGAAVAAGLALALISNLRPSAVAVVPSTSGVAVVGTFP